MLIVGDRRRQDLFGIPGTPGVPVVDRRRPQTFVDRHIRSIALALGVLLVLWSTLGLTTPSFRIAFVAPKAQIGLESAAVLAWCFSALVLFLFPSNRVGTRLRWAATALLVLSTTGMCFGVAGPILGIQTTTNAQQDADLCTRTVACLVLAMGFVPRRAPRLSWITAGVIVILATGLALLAARISPALPALVHPDTLRVAVYRRSPLAGFTAWHWIITPLGLIFACAAAWGAARHLRGQTLHGWLLVAMILVAGDAFQSLFSPASFDQVLTNADVLEFAVTLVVAVGGILELRRIAAERATLLAVEQENSRRLTDLNVLKADFTAMVAHELHSPLAALRGYAAMLALDDVPREQRQQAVSAIDSQLTILSNLVRDVQQAASVEREDFAIAARPVSLHSLISQAAAFARTLPGNHQIVLPSSTHELVWADPERIGQVLRNLLSNAAKYSEPGTPIELHISRHDQHVQLSVKDQGIGIHPNDLGRIFEKFGRGRNERGRRVPGVGLGLYLSRRIAQAHGSDLAVASNFGAGSTFSFRLEVVL